jgi:hypothetical protein
MDPILKPLIDEHTLRYLLDKTMAFLSLVAHPSSALQIDYRILEHTGSVTGLRPLGHPLNTNSSFSSNNTSDVPMAGH